MRTKEIKAFTIRKEGDKWIKTPLKVIRNPEMSNSEAICFGWTCIPIRGTFKNGDCICVTNDNDIPIIIPGEKGDEVLILPEYMEMESLHGVSLKKPFHIVRGMKIYNYKKVEAPSNEPTKEQVEEK